MNGALRTEHMKANVGTPLPKYTMENPFVMVGKWAAEQLGVEDCAWNMRIQLDGKRRGVFIEFIPQPASTSKKAKPAAKRKARSPK